MIDRLLRYVATPSVSREEGPLADLIAGELERAGLSVRRAGRNLWCEVGDTPRPRLLLNSHLDTVPPGRGWNHDPHKPQVVDVWISGLGANDAKGCVTAMIEAVLNTLTRLGRGERLGGTVVLALTAEEETSGQGLGTIKPRLDPLDAALVGEPTGLVPMIAQRGLLILRGVARGRTAHPANTPPDRAENAIVMAARDLVRLREFDWGPAHPLLGACHGNVTRIQGGIAKNVIPDACEFTLDVRTTPAESHAALTARLRGVLESEVVVYSDRLVPVETSPNADIVAAIRRARPGASPAGSRTMSDMVYLTGTPAVKIGPGESARSHAPNEYITTDELADGARTYERIIWEYCRSVKSHD